jgi:hypothetical protein
VVVRGEDDPAAVAKKAGLSPTESSQLIRYKKPISIEQRSSASCLSKSGASAVRHRSAVGEGEQRRVLAPLGHREISGQVAGTGMSAVLRAITQREQRTAASAG